MEEIDRAQVRAARALLNWTQPELASAAGIGLATLQRFESGARIPIPVVKDAIVRALKGAGVEFQYDGKQVGVSLRVRKLPKSE